MFFSRAEEWSPVQNYVVANQKDGWKEDPLVKVFLVSPLRQLQVFVGFLADILSSFDALQPGIHETGRVIVSGQVGASWGDDGPSCGCWIKCQAEGGTFMDLSTCTL